MMLVHHNEFSITFFAGIPLHVNYQKWQGLCISSCLLVAVKFDFWMSLMRAVEKGLEHERSAGTDGPELRHLYSRHL